MVRMMINIQETFAKHGDKFLKSDGIFKNNDLYAFDILKKYRNKNNQNIILCSMNDVVYLNVDIDLMTQYATEDEIIALIRCGILMVKDRNYYYFVLGI